MKLRLTLLAGAAVLATAGLSAAALAQGTYSWGTPQTTYYYGPSTTSGYYEGSPGYRGHQGGPSYPYHAPYTAYSGTSTGGVDMRGEGSGRNYGATTGYRYTYEQQVDPSIED